MEGGDGIVSAVFSKRTILKEPDTVNLFNFETVLAYAKSSKKIIF